MCESILSLSPKNYEFQRTEFDDYQLWRTILRLDKKGN
jgi:hypothetical protein